MNVSRLGEFGLIGLIAKHVPQGKAVCGIGDDAAVLPYTKDKYLLLKTDMLVEGAHFTRRMDAKAVGYKALARNISDIAAMGGLPKFAVVALGLPKSLPVRLAQDIYRGIGSLAKTFDVGIVGGDVSKSDKIIISVALLGEVEKKYLVTRCGAKTGDWIFVSGLLGGSFKNGRHLNFMPRVAEARFLAKQFKPNAMIDISDGLAGDLNHVLKASRKGARLWQDCVPRQKGIGLKQALSEGEDFELLFTLGPAKARQLLQWQAKRKAFYFYPVGRITADIKEKVHVKSFTHF